MPIICIVLLELEWFHISRSKTEERDKNHPLHYRQFHIWKSLFIGRRGANSFLRRSCICSGCHLYYFATMTKYIVVSGGVVSGIGKGVIGAPFRVKII